MIRKVRGVLRSALVEPAEFTVIDPQQIADEGASRMTTQRGRHFPLVLLAAGLNALAWFMPTVALPVASPRDPPEILNGWQTFKEALLPFDITSAFSGGILFLASPLTNLAFLVAMVASMRDGGRLARASRAIEATLWTCFALNCLWLSVAGAESLFSGYYVWLGSFALLALAIRQGRGHG
jgi:hypothetical protein